jgi:hypothetical protein
MEIHKKYKHKYDKYRHKFFKTRKELQNIEAWYPYKYVGVPDSITMEAESA